MTDLSEFKRLAESVERRTAIGAYITKNERKMIVDSLRFRANASEEVIARALDNETLDDQASPTERMMFVRGAQRRRIESLVQARAVLAALEKPATAPVT